MKQMRDLRDESAWRAALEVLRHNRLGPGGRLPRAAGWGYHEPYTRDLMLCSLGILASGDDLLVASLRLVLEALAQSQSRLGQIPSLADEPDNLGSSDTTPLFLLALGFYRHHVGDETFLEQAAARALSYLLSQRPDERGPVAQQPTTDWRDEQWVLGHGLYVNALAHGCFRRYGCHDEARSLRESFEHAGETHPLYPLWFFKSDRSDRVDLLGHSLAILTGLADKPRAAAIIDRIEASCDGLRTQGLLGPNLPPPNFFPFILPEDPDWRPRYQTYNQPGVYHNGGIWPFVAGFYIAACTASGRGETATAHLQALTQLAAGSRRSDLEWGFNEWYRPQDGSPAGHDWQSWSAGAYLYAASLVHGGPALIIDDAERWRR